MVTKAFAVLLVLVTLVPEHELRAQTIDLYSRITDPRGIARLDAPDSGRTFAVTFHGDARWNIDSTDHIPDVAKDSGSGVITHIWSTLGDADTTVILSLYLNDTLLIKDYYNEFFHKLRGFLRPPLDTFSEGAYVWDAQIPYHHGFRLAMQATTGNVYFAFEWHRVPGNLLPWIPLHTLAAPTTQSLAENRFLSISSPWHDTDAITIERQDTLSAARPVELADVSGPGMLQVLRFRTSSYELSMLDSLWLDIYWDRSPVPSIHVPLKDFFLSPVNVTHVRSLQLRADRDSGFISYFPMPFAVHARVKLVRTGSTPIVIASSIQYHREPIDRNAYGYLHADFSESNPTKYHVWHPVIHTVGRGRYVGFGWGIMGHPYSVFLEGNPRFQVDSDAAHFIEYTGGEDYLDGAWWFGAGPFTLPFAGYTDFVDQFYRFHYMDCYEFDHSFDFDFEPGNALDIYDHFRTVGYYYKHWTPFWTSRDTLVPGETWQIGGSGYPARTSLPITLGPINLSVTTDDSGSFNTSLTIPSAWQPGVYYLSVAAETAPEKYYVYAAPTIRPLVDTLPITLRAGDSLWVKGLGFKPGETVSFYLDSIPLEQSVVTNSNNEFVTMLRMPYVAEHSYLLIARGEYSGNATADLRVTITRTADYEFEDLMPPTLVTPGQCYAEDVSYFWETTWSKQMFVYFKPDTVLTGAQLEFQFTTPKADTFDVTYHASWSSNNGRYAVRLDGDSIASLDSYRGYGFDPFPTGPIDLGIHYLPAGIHHIRFTCLGKADSATHYWIEPDCLVLRPTTYMPPTPGTILAGVTPSDTPQSQSQDFSLDLYPNPVYGAGSMPVTLHLSLTLPASDAGFHQAGASVRVFDVLGREIPARLAGYVANGMMDGRLEVTSRLPGTYFVQVSLIGNSGVVRRLPMKSVEIE